MRKIFALLASCLFLFSAQFSLAQESRALRTSIVSQEDAPVTLSAYEGVFRTFEEGLMSVVYLEESIALDNISDHTVTAYEISIVYSDAFGDQIETVRETAIKNIAAHSTLKDTFKQPVYFDTPVYSAVAYINRLRLEPDGENAPALLWQADSSKIEASLKKLRNAFQAPKSSE